MPDSRTYKVTFINQGKVYELYAKSVGQGSLFGFIEVEELLFGQKAQMVVDPSEESLKNEFKGVRRTYIPLHAVVRVDEVDKEGVSRVAPGEEGTITPFPGPIYGSPGSENDS